MRIVLAGGGTAGHINPALAIAQALKSADNKAEILFIGNQNSLEETLVKRAGFDIKFIKIQGLNRRQLHKNITTVKLLLKAIKDAGKIIKEFSPDVVVGTGGYVSGPVLFAAHKLGVHTCIHEQNAFPGLTSKILSRRVEKVFISFENSAKYFKDSSKLILTGNPLRQEFSALDRKQSRDKLGLKDEDFYVLSFGGSLGARVLNETMLGVFEKNKEKDDFVHCHAMGKLGKDWMPERLKQMEIPVGAQTGRYRISDYIHDMSCQMAAADAVIARAGAITIGELLAQGKAAILIPSPNVTHNHQYHNALALAEKNAALMIEEKDLSVERLYETILSLKQDTSLQQKLSRSAEKMAHCNAAQVIADEIQKML